MRLTQKHIIGIIISGLVLVGGYFAVQNNAPSQSDGVNTISQSGIEADTGKRLETVENSGTGWGMSPFGSEKPVFQKPNTEWETRTINGITYVFGQGNPKEVALNASEIAKLPDLARTQEVFYMTPEAELGMKAFLDSSDLTTLLEKCHEQLAWSNPYPGEGYTFPHDLSMETMMYIDPKTGQKRFNHEMIRAISSNLSSLYTLPARQKECLGESEYPILKRTMELWVKTGDGIPETPLNPMEPIIRVPGPDTNSPRPSWYNSGTPHDGDTTPFR